MSEQDSDPVEEQPVDEDMGELMAPDFDVKMPGTWMPGLPPIAPIIEPTEPEDEEA